MGVQAVSNGILDFLQRAFGMPELIYLVAPALGLLLGAFITQWIKFMRPIRWRSLERNVWIRGIAFMSCGGIAWLALPTRIGFVLAVLAGAAAPFAYYVAAKRWRWWRDLFSGDPRGAE